MRRAEFKLYREVGRRGTWSVSSYKGVFGVRNLRDDDLSTFWQYAPQGRPGRRPRSTVTPGEPTQVMLHRTSGRTACSRTRSTSSLSARCGSRYGAPRPTGDRHRLRGAHLVQDGGSTAGARQRVAVYLDMRLDESYTPNKLMLRTGSTFHDLTDGPVVELVEPSGWCVIPVANSCGEYVSIAACGVNGTLQGRPF